MFRVSLAHNQGVDSFTNQSLKLFFSLQYNNISLLQLGCYPMAVVILHVNKTLNWLLINLSREGYMRSM